LRFLACQHVSYGDGVRVIPAKDLAAAGETLAEQLEGFFAITGFELKGGQIVHRG
jgi:hypothetical protein